MARAAAAAFAAVVFCIAALTATADAGDAGILCVCALLSSLPLSFSRLSISPFSPAISSRLQWTVSTGAADPIPFVPPRSHARQASLCRAACHQNLVSRAFSLLTLRRLVSQVRGVARKGRTGHEAGQADGRPAADRRAGGTRPSRFLWLSLSSPTPDPRWSMKSAAVLPSFRSRGPTLHLYLSFKAGRGSARPP